MQRTRSMRIAAFLTLGVCVSVAAGGAPMGPPIAVLDEGQWSVGGEFAHEQMDLEAFGISVETIDGDFSTFYAQPFTLEDLAVNMGFVTLGYGVCDNWDLFLRAGAADAKDDLILHPATADNAEDKFGFDGDFGFAWGAGTRATFCRTGPWNFGGLIQVTWFDPGSSDFQLGEIADPLGYVTGDADIKYWQTQVALTVAYEADTWRVWGGPFLQFIEGDLELDGQYIFDGDVVGTVANNADVEELSQFGAHVGISTQLADQWNLWVEGQITGDSWLIGIGAAFTPESLGL
ncbi:MAG TPA: hypothetical protein VLI39_11845 [Sedimentisphaerales bacterium]|nr:hypothetical protein [Sedimentisphaerales bacterium]